MILAIDVGNTNIVLGCIEDGKILNIVRLQTRVGETETEYAIKLRQLLEFYNIDTQAFEGVILSSVVPPVTAVLQKAVKMVTGVTCSPRGGDQPAAGYLHHAAGEGGRLQHGGLHALRRGVRHRRHSRRADRAHGGRARLSLPPCRHRGSGLLHHALLPAGDRL